MSALVVSLTVEPRLRTEALQRLSEDPRITVGTSVDGAGCDQRQAAWVPVVLATDSIREGRVLAESIEELAGVQLVELVSLDFSDEPA